MLPPGRVRTIADLATLAGVSPGTVSRALNGSPLVRAQTRERIAALAREHDFRLNLAARSLRTRRTGAIGVVVPRAAMGAEPDPLAMALLAPVGYALAARGHDLVLMQPAPDAPGWLAGLAASGRVDGVIVIAPADAGGLAGALSGNDLPLVVWGDPATASGACTVGPDDAESGRLAAMQLIAGGCRRLAFLGPGTAAQTARLNGFRAAAREAGLPAPAVIDPALLMTESPSPAIAAWLNTFPVKPDGLFAGSDMIAMSALQGLAECGLSVPGQARIVGHDNLAVAARTIPPLTTVAVDLAAAAACLVERLFRRIAGEPAGPALVAPGLVVRASA